MPIVQLPDGRRVKFPDTMSLEDIETLIPTLPSNPEGATVPRPVTPQLTISSDPIPRELEDVVPRTAFTGPGGALGSILGGATGLPAAPATGGLSSIGGAIVGGGFGAAGGSAAFDAVDTFLKEVGIFPDSTPPATLEEISRKAATEGLIDLGFSAGGAVIKPLFNILRGGRPVIGRLLGVANEEAARITRAAAGEGIDLGLVDLSTRKVVKGFPRTLGVFPFIGTPFTKLRIKGREQIAAAGADLLDELAPTGLMGDLGIDLVESAKSRHGAFRRGARLLYGQVDRLIEASSNPKIIPTETLKKSAGGALEQIERETAQAGKRTIAPKLRADARRLLEDVLNLDDTITPFEYRGINRRIKQLLEQTSKTGLATDTFTSGKLVNLKKAGDLDFQNLRADLVPEGAEIVEALEKANKFFSTHAPKFENSLARKLQRAGNIFGPGPFKPGTRQADEMAASVLRNASPQDVKDLRQLVGQKNLNRYTRETLERAWTSSVIEPADLPKSAKGIETIDINMFARKIGLEGDNKLRGEALQEMLKGTNVSLNELNDFVSLAKIAGARESRDPATFIMRRLILTGGGTAAVGGSALAGGGSVSLPLAAGITLLSRHMAKKLTNPQTLRNMTSLLEATVPTAVKNGILLRMAAAAGAGKDELDALRGFLNQGIGDGS